MRRKYSQGLLRRIFVHNFYLKLIAFALTLALYFWVSEDRETIVVGYAPVRMVVPQDMVLTSDPVDRVRVTIRGRWSAITRVDPSQLEPIVVNVPSRVEDAVLPISGDMVSLPPTLRIVSIEPNHIRARLEARQEKQVTVVANVVGQPQASYKLGNVRVEPRHITIYGPRDALDQTRTIPTETLDVTGMTRSFERQVRLRPDNRFVEYDTNTDIRVSVSISAEESTRTLDDIPVEVINTSYQTTIQPRVTSIIVRGPSQVIDTIDPDIILASVDLSDAENRPPGTYQKDVSVRNLPPNIAVEQIYPETFQVTTLPRD